jgi:hypothetical protein
MEVYIINSIAKSYILNIKIRPPVTEYALRIKLVDGHLCLREENLSFNDKYVS